MPNQEKNNFFQIAIDGPVAAGKGTISRLVAQRLGFLYVDTGAMYRVAALLALRANLDLTEGNKISQIVSKADIAMRNPTEEEKDGRLTTVLVDGEDVSWKIRTEEISQASSQVSQYPEVRRVLVKKQQQIAETTNVIMEGRDITYRVLPQANLKLYLTANEIVRANRRHLELQIRGQDVSYEQVYQDLLARDQRDMTRTTDPLHIVPDAWVIDSSDLSIEKVVEIIVARVKMMRGSDN